MATDGDDPTFQSVDLADYDATGRVVDRRTWAFLACLVALLGTFLYDTFVLPPSYALVWALSPGPIDWLAAFSALLLLFYVVIPLAQNPRLTRLYWRRFRRHRLAVVALGYLGAFAVLGLVGPELWGSPDIAPRGYVSARGPPPGHPPFWGAVAEQNVFYCATTVVDGMCQGTLVHPLGTTPAGKDVLAFVFAGMRVALEVALISAALIVPVATAVGTVSAYFGGRVDAGLMRYVDLQQAVPAFVVYLLVQYLYGPSLVAVIVLFGLLDWGRIARRVRGDALRERSAGYVMAARSAGSRPTDVIRRHLVPNVVNSIVSGLSIQIPFILIMEATLSYLGYVNSTTPSWGYAIKVGLDTETAVGGSGLANTAGFAWWSYTFPILALFVTVVAMSLVGDALHDAVEPRDRGEQS